MLHEAIESGERKLVSATLSKLHSLDAEGGVRDIRTGTRYLRHELVNFQNYDGSTPLHLARIHKRSIEDIPLLLAAGASPHIRNRFGEPALPLEITTATVRGAPVTSSNIALARELMRESFADPRFERERPIAERQLVGLSSGESTFVWNDHRYVGLGAHLWHRGDTPVGISITGLDPQRPHRLWLSYLGVPPEQRGQGIGGDIVEGIRTFGSEHGFRQVAIMTGNAPGNRAMPFFRRHDFRGVQDALLSEGEFKILTSRIHPAT